MNGNILFEPYSREFSRDPYLVYAQLRRQQPVFFMGTGVPGYFRPTRISMHCL
jgi:hypothetical protein